MEQYLRERGQTAKEVEPLTREFYLDYVEWFQAGRLIEPEPVRIEQLDRDRTAGASFVASLSDGQTITAQRVVLTLGMGYFAHVPDELAAARQYIRVIDETGEDYLYPAKFFVPIEVRPEAARLLPAGPTPRNSGPR